jgi:hypothetical protein
MTLGIIARVVLLLLIFIPRHGLQARQIFPARLISGFEGFPVPFRRFIEVFLCAVPFIAAVFLAEQSRRGFRHRSFGKRRADSSETQTKGQYDRMIFFMGLTLLFCFLLNGKESGTTAITVSVPDCCDSMLPCPDTSARLLSSGHP